jgi:predicted transcriptional regulator
MKTATMPALRVRPELRQAAEEILRPGETLSAFVEDSLRRNVELRRAQQEFIARGLASRDAARESGEYVSAKKVLNKLSAKLKKAQAKQSSK